MYRVVKTALENGIVRYEVNVDAMREYIHVDDAARASVDAIKEEFKNESVVLTGQEPMKVIDMLKMLSEILGIPAESVEFVEDKYAGHYIRTPYSYQPKLGRKYIPPMHVDLGQGLLQVINEFSYIENDRN